ncbi:MAG: glycine cleavage system protein GcvH [Turicibacter sp.]|nr:glycine cleavage system protein GcvH [Turicibacter sp.]
MDPKNLSYTKQHEWVSLADGTAKIGLTDYAQNAMGDIVYIGFPDIGDALTLGDSCCDIESVKAVSHIYAPVDGEISAINEALEDEPDLINKDPYNAWIIEASSITETADLMNHDQYEDYLKTV